MNRRKPLPVIWPITPIQKKLFHDDTRFIWCPAGRRARKTLIFSRKLLLNALTTPGIYLMAAPVEEQAIRVFWENPYNSLKENTRPFWTRKPREDRHIVYIRSGPHFKYESEIHVFGLHSYTRVDGSPWNGALITEIDECKEEAWTKHIRITMSDTGGFAYLDGVPEMGKGWYYRMCLDVCGGALPRRDEKLRGSYGFNPKMPNYCYYHWYSADVLPLSEIEDLRRTLDPVTFRIEMMGSFENMQAAAYYQFSDDNLDRSIIYNPSLPVDVGMDFNVNPMTATFSHFIDGKLLTFGEAELHHSNTISMANHIKENVFPGRSPGTITIFPDSTGNNPTANADYSSIQILRRAGFKVMAPKSNPRQKTRLMTVNSALKNMAGEVHWKINPDTCKRLVNGLNTTERKADGTINKDDLSETGHNITDAASYNVFRRLPVQSATISSF